MKCLRDTGTRCFTHCIPSALERSGGCFFARVDARDMLARLYRWCFGSVWRCMCLVSTWFVAGNENDVGGLTSNRVVCDVHVYDSAAKEDALW